MGVFILRTVHFNSVVYLPTGAMFISPLPACRGTLSLLAVCLSVRQSVRLSVKLQFTGLFSAVFLDIDLKFGI